MIVIVVSRSLLLTATMFVEPVGRDVMKIDELTARLFCHLAVPLAISVVATLDLPVFPLIAWCQRDDDWCGAFLTGIINKLLQIPAEAINKLIGTFRLALIDMARIGSTGYLTALLVSINTSNVVVSKVCIST